MSDIRTEISNAISQLEQQGITKNSHLLDTVGLGDKVESVLQSMGITEERFKEWFNLKECGCSKRKAWLNSLFSWKKSQG
ncbi:MAG: hypothetical protein EBU90_20285 [Proteobacteria bacterium]|nr:hypothetical protein [Pseudomonadota bacterium]NBP16032.1 hypothetical protein [bacterium]